MKNPLKSLVKRVIKSAAPYIWLCLQEVQEAQAAAPVDVPVDNSYAWLTHAFNELMKDPVCARRCEYAWGVAQAAALGKVLGLDRVSVVEFGVAGGYGLLCMERCAALIERNAGIGIDVYGLDSGVGLPRPVDYRDQPNMWFEGQLPMNRDVLEQELDRAQLRIGFLEETIAGFMAERPAPIAFVSVDVDLYSSTRDALTIFRGDYDLLLPRVICYFDDICGHSYSDFTGERLAISEFNDAHPNRKLSPIYSLRHFVPSAHRAHVGWDGIYFAHFYDHPLYNKPDSLKKAVRVDEKGNVYRESFDSRQKSEVSA